MPETGLTQSGVPSPITRPIGSPPSNTSPRSSAPSNISIASKELPTPDTLRAYIAIKKQPYAVEYFGVGRLSQIPSYSQWAQTVDEYVLAEIQRNGLKDSVDVYRQIVDKISKGMGLDSNTLGSVKLHQIARWIKEVIAPMRRVEIAKDKILYARASS